MKKRNFIIIGFVASIISILFGTVALLHINNQKETNDEKIKAIEVKIEETLKLQQLSYLKYDLAELGFGVSHVLKNYGQREYIDAVQRMLVESDVFLFCAANGLPEEVSNEILTFLEYIKSKEGFDLSDLTDEDWAEDKESLAELLVKLLRLTNTIPIYDSVKNIDVITKERFFILSELKNKFFNQLGNLNTSLNNLQNENKNLNIKLIICTYISTFMQVIGLAFIFLKDLGTD